MREINFEDAGRYSVRVTNMYGAVTSGAALLIVPNRVVVWGNNTYGQTNVPIECSNAVAIAAGAMHAAALTEDGRPLIWGGSTNAPFPSSIEASNVIAVAGGLAHTLALLADGTVLAWGDDTYGEASVPANLTNVVAVAGGDGFSLALKRDGTLTAWGRSDWGVTNVPATATNVVSFACGAAHIVALKNDNTVACWGNNDAGQASPPEGLRQVVAVAAGDNHSVALRSDGTIVTWGSDGETPGPAELTNVVAIAAGEQYSVALKDDGRIFAWGTGTNTVGSPPWWLENVISVAARGSNASMALLGTGSPSLTVQPWDRSIRAGSTTIFHSMAVGSTPLAFQWRKNGTDLEDSERYTGTRTGNLSISGVQATDADAFTLVVSNGLGAVTSRVATLTVTEPGWQWARAAGNIESFSQQPERGWDRKYLFGRNIRRDCRPGNKHAGGEHRKSGFPCEVRL